MIDTAIKESERILGEMKIISSISSWIIGHISLIIVVLISYFVGLILLDFYLPTVVGVVMVVLLIVFFLHPRLYIYFLIFITPLIGIITQLTGFRVGGLYSGINLGGVMTILGLTFGMSYLVLKKPRIFEYELTVPMLFFLAVVLLSVAYAPMYKLFAFRHWARYAAHAFIYFIILDSFKDLKDAKKLLNFLFLVFVPMSIFFILAIYFPSLRGGIMRETTLEFSSGMNIYRLSGFLHATSIGSIIVIYLVLTMFYFSESPIKDRWKYIVLFIILPFLLLNTLARNAWITFVVVMFIVGVLRFRKFCLVFLLIGVFVLGVVPDISELIWLRMQPDPAALGRIVLAKMAWELFLQKPILGWGQGYFQIWSGEHLGGAAYGGIGGVDIHNEYLRTMVCTGIVGLFAYLFLIYRGLKSSFKLFKIPHSTAKNYSMVSLAVVTTIAMNALTGQGFRMMGFYFWIFLGIGEIFLRNLRSPPQHA